MKGFIKFIAILLVLALLGAAIYVFVFDGDFDFLFKKKNNEESPKDARPSETIPEKIPDPTPPEEDLPSTRYSLEGHMPMSLTETKYNDNGQLISVTPLNTCNLMPDYENMQYTMARTYEYTDDGMPIKMILNKREAVSFNYVTEYSAIGYAGEMQIKLSVNENGIILEEEYSVKGDIIIIFQYDNNGNLIKDTRPDSDIELAIAYNGLSFDVAFNQYGDTLVTLNVNVDDEGKIVSISADDETAEYTYDSKGRVSKVVEGDSTYQTVYDTFHRTVLTKGTTLTDNGAKKTVDYKYEFDENDNIVKFYIDSSSSAPYEHKIVTYNFALDGNGFEKTTVTTVYYDQSNNAINTTIKEY